MKVRVDQADCQGHGVCAAIAPDVFSLDELGYSNIEEGLVVPAGSEDRARLAARSCPERAIRLEDS